MARTLKVVGRTLLTKAQLVRAIERRQAARAKKPAPYRYTPMYPKPVAQKASASGVTTRRSASASPTSGDTVRRTALDFPSGEIGAAARARSSRLRRDTMPARAARAPAQMSPSWGRRGFDEQFLPDHYGETRLVAQARDPHWLHAYWELAGEEARRAAGGRKVLRVYELTVPQFSSATIRHWYDIAPTPEARDWFLEVGQPACWWCLELGVTDPGGFVPLVRSNLVETPADRPSDDYEAGWPRLADALAAQMAGQVSSSRAPGRFR